MFEAHLTDAQRDYVLGVLRQQQYDSATADARRGAIESLELARPVDLPAARLDWSALEAEADRQGCSPADVIWDRARGKEPEHG